MVLPAVEETPILLLRFTPKVNETLVDLVATRLTDAGMIVLERTKIERSNQTVLTLTTTHQHLEEQAELGHYMKLDTETNIVDYFSSKKRYSFAQTDKNNHSEQGHLDKYGLFTPCDWLALTTRLFNSITVLPEGEKQNKLSNLLKTEFDADYLLHDVDIVDLDTMSNSARWANSGERSDCLRHVLESYDLVDVITPVHLPAIRREIMHRATLGNWFQIAPPVAEYQAYYGWEVAYYFAWMAFLSKWLVFPGVLGFLVYALRLYRGDSIDTDEFTPFYGLITFVWAVCFLRFWERQENLLAYQWGTFSMTAYERQKFFAKRLEFHGYLRVSPVTGEFETYFPNFRRRLRFLVSAVVTLGMLAVAFCVMILSLNLQGYISPSNNPERWHADNPHPFHFPTLATLAEKDQLFDNTSAWRVYIPTVLHVACIMTLNNIYRTIAEKLTEYENHETELSHSNSLILKRFLFEAFDCYVALFYLAFYERDVVKLRSELVAVFQVDTVRRVLLESVVPVILLWLKLGRVWNPSADKKAKENTSPSLQDILREADMDPYESFDDYMEICIQLGYVTLFASAYPLASLISIFANWVEVRSDSFKLAFCQRPIIHRAHDLGMWRALFSTVIWVSALTNCLIAGFTSDQLVHYLPSFYVGEETGFRSMGHEKGWVLVFVIFGLERMLLVTGLVIYNAIPEVPESLLDMIEKRQYLRSKAGEAAKREERKRAGAKKDE